MLVLFSVKIWKQTLDVKYLYIILLWCSILTLVRIDASNAMIKSIGNERRHQLVPREPKIIINSTEENKLKKQENYIIPSISASVEHQESTVTRTSDNHLSNSLNDSDKIMKASSTLNMNENNKTLGYYTDTIYKIINQTIKTVESIKFLHDSFYKNQLYLDNNTESNNIHFNNTNQTINDDNFDNYSEQSPLLLEPIAESDRSHILSLIKTKKSSKSKPKSVQTTTTKPRVNETDGFKENSNMSNVTSNENQSNLTSEEHGNLTRENVNIKDIVPLQNNISDSVIKYITQSDKSEITPSNISEIIQSNKSESIKQNKTENSGSIFVENNIHIESMSNTSAKPVDLIVDGKNYTTPGNTRTMKVISSVFDMADIENNTLDKYSFDTFTKPSADNHINIGNNVVGFTQHVETGSSDVPNYINKTSISHKEPILNVTKAGVKAVISSKYDPAWRNKSLSAIGIKIGTKNEKQRVLYSKHAVTNLTVFTEKPQETSINQFKTPSLRERLGQLSKKRYRLRKVTTNHSSSSTSQVTTSSPFTLPSSTFTTSSSAWILYNGTHHMQDNKIQNAYTEFKKDSEARATANQKLLQGLTSSHIEFLYDFDKIPTASPLLKTDQSSHNDNSDVAMSKQVMNGHQRNFGDRVPVDVFHSTPNVSSNKSLKPQCEHKNIELFAEYDDNISHYISHNREIRRKKRDTQRVKSPTEFENLITNLTMLLFDRQNDTEANEDDADDFWINSDIAVRNFTRTMETTTNKISTPVTEVTPETWELTFDDILNSKLAENDTVNVSANASVPTLSQVNSNVQQKVKSKRKPYISHRKSKPIKLEHKSTSSLNKTEVNNRNQSSLFARHSLTEKRTTIAPGRKKVVQKNIYKKPKLITPEAVEITVESKGNTIRESQTAQNITTDLAKLMMVLMSKTEDLD